MPRPKGTAKGKVTRAMTADGGWWKSQVTAGNLLSIGTIAFGFAGFYFNTSASIEAQAKAIMAIERRFVEAEKKDDKREQNIVSERDNLRKEVNELSKTTAVLSSQLVTTNTELMKLSQKIDSLLAPLAAPQRR